MGAAIQAIAATGNGGGATRCSTAAVNHSGAGWGTTCTHLDVLLAWLSGTQGGRGIDEALDVCVGGWGDCGTQCKGATLGDCILCVWVLDVCGVPGCT